MHLNGASGTSVSVTPPPTRSSSQPYESTRLRYLYSPDPVYIELGVVLFSYIILPGQLSPRVPFREIRGIMRSLWSQSSRLCRPNQATYR